MRKKKRFVTTFRRGYTGNWVPQAAGFLRRLGSTGGWVPLCGGAPLAAGFHRRQVSTGGWVPRVVAWFVWFGLSGHK